MLEVGERRYSNFQLQGFWFEKEVFYYGDYVDMKITCNRTEQLVVSACFTSADDYETQKENIIAMLNDYLDKNTTENERLFNYLTSNNWNHDLFD
ncbi:hypothetical protein [Mammaliicoccus lentus]|uniref:hypothetical protein n=1 Tax=Mammaliicoccus lentus TaxID=42858 RepID=UPI0010720B64|nr:hypothetical protein [Mammaliicoccus lentus]MBF0750525.1 hypothetical protein [Mammaliicoccus lentus]TFU56384.1 hypothetical protein E4T93_14155 [Mammaliicoccus lentus]